MRLLLSVFLMFILVSSATMTNFAFAYEKENHYWLKIALALNCGFTLDEARLIGIGDFSIDEDPDTQPVRSGSDKDNAKWKWHALPTENPDVDKNEVSKGNQEIKQRQHELYDRAMNEKDTPMKLFKFGQYLHYQEDKWSHWGYTTGMGHAVPNVVPGMDSPDETHANPEHYRYMVFDSMVNLGKLAKSLGKDTECVSTLVPLDTYKSAPEYGKDFPWFSPQEIKRSKDPLKFQKDVNKHLSDWKKSALIDEVITVSDKKGDDGVTDSFISYIAKHTGKSKSDITKKYDYSHIEIDENGNAKTIPENLVKSVKAKEEKNNKKTTDKAKNDTIAPKTLSGLYTAIKWAEYSKRALSDAISQDKHLKTQLKQDSKDLSKLGSQIKKIESEIKKDASSAKVSSSDLNKAAKEPLEKLKSKKESTTENSLKEAKAAIGKLDSIVDSIGYSGGIDPSESEKILTIPEDMKDLPGLGDSAVELKVLRKSGIYEGDPCSYQTINTYFHWMLSDKKENTPKVPMYIIFEAWKNGKKMDTFMIQNTSDGDFVRVSDDYDPNKTLSKETFDRLVKETKGKVNDSFKVHFTTHSDLSEQIITLKIIRVGPAYSGYVYSGNGDEITVKIPACPKKPATESKQAPENESEPMIMIDSVVDDLVTETVDPFTGLIREKKINIAIQQTSTILHDVLDRAEQTRGKTPQQVDEGIKKKEINSKTQSEQKLTQDQIKTIYKISSDIRILSSTLVKINDNGAKELKTLASDSQKAYALTKDQKYKKFSQQVDKKLKEVQADKKHLVQLDKISKKLNEQISKNSVKSGLKKSELEKIDKNAFIDSAYLKLELKGKTPSIDLVRTPSVDLERFFSSTIEHDAKLIGEILSQTDDKAPENSQTTSKPNQDNPNTPPKSILDNIDISDPLFLKEIERSVDISKLVGLDTIGGRQFIGNESDLLAYFGPAGSTQFAQTDAIDALRYDWDGIVPAQKEKPRESILDEIEEPTLAEMFGGKPKTRADDSIAGKTGLRVLKKVNNEGGGTKEAADFIYYVDLHHLILYPNREYSMPANGDMKILSGLDPGDRYFVHEELDPDYTTKYLDDCSGVIESGKVKTCIIINTYVPKSPSGSQTGTSLGGNAGQAQTGLRVLKIVNNQGGGTKGPADFIYYIDLYHTILYANTAYGMPANGEMKIISGFDSGDKYFVHEELDPDYRTSYAGDCSGMIESGKVKTCTITNTFIPKKSTGTTSSGTQVGVLTPPVTTQPTNTKPTLTIPKQITQEATSSAGAPVNYSVSGQDKEDGAITPSCSYPSGYTFPIGTTTVSCTVDDSDNNSVSGTFTVTVRDTTPPDIPKFQPTEGVRDETGVQVFFEVTAFDLVDGSVPASCNYPSGYKFPIGTTVLTCTADDSRGNHASRSLQITVTITESGQ